MEEKWLEWARKLQGMAQNGLTFSRDPFDRDRYEAIRALAAEMVGHHVHEAPAKIEALFAEGTGYATPKLDVRGAVFRNDELLMVRERSDHKWALPGGWADLNESPAEAVVREIREESGYLARSVKLLALYDKRKHSHPPQLPHAYKVFFQCELLGGEPKENPEIEAIAFFREAALPELSLHRIVESQLHRIFEHYRNPQWPADFD